MRTLLRKQVEVTPGVLSATTPQQFAATQGACVAVVRGALDKDFAGKTLRFVCDAAEATTLASALLMRPDDVTAQKRSKGTLEGEELEAFAEIANALCSGIATVLGARIDGQIGLRQQDHATLDPGAADTTVLGTEPLYAMAMTIAVDKLPATSASILVDRATAERWNGGPVRLAADAAQGGPEGEEDDGPAAPIRGRLAAFLVDNTTTVLLRRGCRRVGLDFDRRPRGDVPNPPALKDSIVLIEIAPNEERRFDWCRRIKTLRPHTKVVLLLAVPSRPHVLQAARVGADVVLGHPVSLQLLMAKLNALLDPAPSEPQPRAPTA